MQETCAISGRISHASKQLSLCATNTCLCCRVCESQLLKPTCLRDCALQQEFPAIRGLQLQLESSPHSLPVRPPPQLSDPSAPPSVDHPMSKNGAKGSHHFLWLSTFLIKDFNVTVTFGLLFKSPAPIRTSQVSLQLSWAPDSFKQLDVMISTTWMDEYFKKHNLWKQKENLNSYLKEK